VKTRPPDAVKSACAHCGFLIYYDPGVSVHMDELMQPWKHSDGLFHCGGNAYALTVAEPDRTVTP
jgi:hypothetical protein